MSDIFEFDPFGCSIRDAINHQLDPRSAVYASGQQQHPYYHLPSRLQAAQGQTPVPQFATRQPQHQPQYRPQPQYQPRPQPHPQHQYQPQPRLQAPSHSVPVQKLPIPTQPPSRLPQSYQPRVSHPQITQHQPQYQHQSAGLGISGKDSAYVLNQNIGRRHVSNFPLPGQTHPAAPTTYTKAQAYQIERERLVQQTVTSTASKATPGPQSTVIDLTEEDDVPQPSASNAHFETQQATMPGSVPATEAGKTDRHRMQKTSGPISTNQPEGTAQSSSTQPVSRRQDQSMPAETFSLFQRDGFNTRISKRRYTQHVREVLALNETNNMLLEWMLEHHNGTHLLIREDVKAKKALVINHLFEEMVGLDSKALGVDAKDLSPTKLDADLVASQVEMEIVTVLGVTPIDPSAPYLAEVERVSEEALSNHLLTYQAMAHAFSVVLTGVLQGNDCDVFEAVTNDSTLKAAGALRKATSKACDAQCFKTSTLKERFYYSNHLKNALANQVIREMEGFEPAFSDDISWLLKLMGYIQFTKTRVLDDSCSTDGDNSNLDTDLRSKAAYFLDEIDEQISSELYGLRSHQKGDGQEKAKKRGREEGQEDEDSQIPPPAKKRGGPQAASTAPTQGQTDMAQPTAKVSQPPVNTTEPSGSHPKQQGQQQTQPAVHASLMHPPQPAGQARTSDTSNQSQEPRNKTATKPKANVKPAARTSSLSSKTSASPQQQQAQVSGQAQDALYRVRAHMDGPRNDGNEFTTTSQQISKAPKQRKASASGATRSQRTKRNSKKRQREEDGDEEDEEIERLPKSARLGLDTLAEITSLELGTAEISQDDPWFGGIDDDAWQEDFFDFSNGLIR